MPGRRSRASETGFTLVEVLIALLVVGVLMGAVMLSFDVGVKAVGRGGAADRAAGARDISAFEQQLGVDISRAACITVGGTAFGACARSLVSTGSVVSTCSSARLCVAWPQHSGTNVGCHVDAYAQPGGAGKKVVRTEYLVGTGGFQQLLSVGVTTTDGVTMAVATPSTTSIPPTAFTPASGGTWVSLLDVTLTASGVVNSAPTGDLQLRPLSADPAGEAEMDLC